MDFEEVALEFLYVLAKDKKLILEVFDKDKNLITSSAISDLDEVADTIDFDGKVHSVTIRTPDNSLSYTCHFVKF